MGRKGKPVEPRDDDPRWLPVVEVHRQLTQQIGNTHLAAVEMTEAVTSGQVRCLRRFVANGSCERVPASFWTDGKCEFVEDPYEGVYARSHRPDIDIRTVRGCVFYLWGPDLEKRRPAMKANDEMIPLPRRKPGPPPTHDWPLVVAAELIRRAKAGERDPTAAAMIEYCEKTFGDEFSPGLREMQKLLRRLLQ